MWGASGAEPSRCFGRLAHIYDLGGDEANDLTSIPISSGTVGNMVLAITPGALGRPIARFPYPKAAQALIT